MVVVVSALLYCTKISKSLIKFYFDQGISSDESKLKHILSKSSQIQAKMLKSKI